MSEQKTPVAEKPQDQKPMEAPKAEPKPEVKPEPKAEPKAPAKKKRKKRKGKLIKKLITLVLVLALLAGGGYGVWKYLFEEEEEVGGEVLTDFVRYDSIINTVEGTGMAKAKSAQTITLTANGLVNEVFVAEGDQVTEGDPLYTIRSEVAEQNVQAVQDRIAGLQKELGELEASLADLVVRAPFDGKLMEITEFYPGDLVGGGTKVATLVNDRTLKLSLYFSYAYENIISVGQKADISIPAVMGSFPGKVEKINKVNFITPEGAKCFEVVFSMKNPGTLTEGMAAAVTLTAADGTPIFPYADGKLRYYEHRDVTTKTGGPVLSANLLNYMDVSAGQTLLTLGDEEIRTQMEQKNQQIAAAQTELDAAIQALSAFDAVAPISGTVSAFSLNPGDAVESGQAAISIVDNTVMTVVLDVDEKFVGNLQPGMSIDLTDWDGNYYLGTLDSVSLEPKNENGIVSYPAVVRVDNFDGLLRNGQSLNYTIPASQSLDCMVVPVICVHYVSDVNGNNVEVVYLKADAAPENTVQLSEELSKTIPEGFYPVPVEVGLSDNMNAEIKSGLNVDDEVFTNIVKEQSDSYQNQGGAMLG